MADSLLAINTRDHMDKSILAGMEGCKIGGEIVLPSGLTIPAPKPGKHYQVRSGQIWLCDGEIKSSPTAE
jgi:hypothetical protein